MRTSWGSATDRRRVRRLDEDAVLVEPSVYAVADVDGMVGTLRATASCGRRLGSLWSTASLRRRPATHRSGTRPPARPTPTSPAAPRASAPGRRDGEP